MPETRPDVRRKREKERAQRGMAACHTAAQAKKMHAAAADLERRAASVGGTVAVMQAEQMSLMLEAAILRREARRL